MNYKQNYEDYILYVKELSREKKKGIYYENHHIIPKFAEGTDDKLNLVLLTAREHFIAYYLLCRIYEETPLYFKALKAFMMMTRGNDRKNFNSKLYEKKKEVYSKELSVKMQGVVIQPKDYRHSEETKRKMCLKRIGGTPAQGMIHSDSSKQKISRTLKDKVWMWNYELNKGCHALPEEVEKYKQLGYLPNCNRKRTEEEKKRTSIQFKGVSKTKEHKKKISDSNKGKPKSLKHIEKMRQSQLGKKATQKTKDKLSKAHKGRIWIHKENETKMIFPIELEQYEELDWKKGRSKND